MPSRSWKTRTWPEVEGPAPMPIVGISSLATIASVIAAGTASKTIAKQPTDCSARASSQSWIASLRGLALGFVAAERGGGLRGQADVAHHRDAGADDRPGALDRDAAGLQLDHLAAGLLDQPLGALDGQLVARLVAAHRHVADHQRRLQAAAHGFAEDDHLLHRDRLGAGVAEHDHRRRVADQDDVDAGRLGHRRRGVVVGGDHHDRFAVRLHLGQARQVDRRAVGGRRSGVGAAAGAHESSTSGWLSTATERLSSSTWTTTGE